MKKEIIRNLSEKYEKKEELIIEMFLKSKELKFDSDYTQKLIEDFFEKM